MANWTLDQFKNYVKQRPDVGFDFGDTPTNKQNNEKQLDLVPNETELFYRCDEPREKELLETQVQSNYIEWVRLNRLYVEVLRSCFAIPNGGSRPIKTAKTMKAEGMEPGVPDLMILSPSRGYAGLIIETKTKYNQPSEEQIEWLNRLARNNFYCVVCWSTASMVDITCWFYNLPDEVKHRWPVG